MCSGSHEHGNLLISRSRWEQESLELGAEIPQALSKMFCPLRGFWRLSHEKKREALAWSVLEENLKRGGRVTPELKPPQGKGAAAPFLGKSELRAIKA